MHGPNCTGPGPNIGTTLIDSLRTILATLGLSALYRRARSPVSLESVWNGSFFSVENFERFFVCHFYPDGDRDMTEGIKLD